MDHQGDRFVMRTNDKHKNSRLATAPGDNPGEGTWTPLVNPTDSQYIRSFEAFKDFIAVEERIDGLDQVRLDRPGGRINLHTVPRVGLHRPHRHKFGISDGHATLGIHVDGDADDRVRLSR